MDTPTEMPNGVTSAGAPPAPSPAPAGPAPAAPPVQGPPTPAAPPMPPVEKWDWLQIGAGIVILTSFCFAIYYYRYKTRQYSQAVKDQNAKINNLENTVRKIDSQLSS